MNYKQTKKWFFRALVVSGTTLVIAFTWMDYEIGNMWGAHTSKVDHEQFSRPQSSIVINNINALSSDGMSMAANQSLLIEQSLIKFIGADISVPRNAIVIDGTGKYLIPGLIDSHVHLWRSANDLLLYLANGVTHIRELNGSDEHLAWRTEIEQGRMGPTLFVASPRLNSNNRYKGWFDQWTAKMANISDSKDAKNVLNSFSKENYDAVKIYSFLSGEDFLAIDAASVDNGIPLLGHIPITLKLDDIWRSNLRELAHIEELVKALDREFGGYDADNAETFLQFIKARGDKVAQNLVVNNMAVVSTLWLMESFSAQRHHLDQALTEVALEYVNPGISELSPLAPRVMGWLPDSNIYRIGHHHSAEILLGDKLYWESYAKAHHLLLQAMIKKNVTILAGTDANVPTTVPGFSMHDELKSLVDAGMSASQALRSATAVPAKWMNIKSGKIAQGYNADLVVLDANPLEDITHTKNINTVISRGRLIPRQTLDDMLMSVKKANDHSRTVNIDQYR